MKLMVAVGLLAFIALVQAAYLPDPKAVDPSEVKFYHYSRDNIDTGELMFNGNLNNAHWLPWRPTKFIVHNFEGNGFDDWVLDMKLKMVTAEDCNVIVVDWKDPAAGLYGNVEERVKPVGTLIGEFVDYLVSQEGDLATMHCVGFGLGAHCCGFAGKYQTHGTMGRITGLDPNKEGFHFDETTERLYIDDAMFVDVIHTSSGADSFIDPMGHADFYPNNGQPSQPGCGAEALGFTQCSHLRSQFLFTESLYSSGFKSKACDSWNEYKDGACDNNEEVVMGNKLDVNARGKFYLRTYGQNPFAMG